MATCIDSQALLQTSATRSSAAAIAVSSSMNEVFQEVVLLVVVVVVFFAWSGLSERHAPRRSCVPAPLTPKAASVRLRAALPKAQEPRAGLRPPLVRAAEKQMLQLLEQKEFTRALGLYRSCERDGRDKHLVNMDLFEQFVHSAIRVGKVDVLECFFLTLRRNALRPSASFWSSTLRMLAGRRFFAECLLAYSCCGVDSFPVDRTVFSCLINASLECGQANLAFDELLDVYTKSITTAKDFILHFRVYAAVGSADAAAMGEDMLHKLGVGSSNLMLNLTLLACVHAKRPARASTVLSWAETAVTQRGTDAEPLVDRVSYNTLIKGYLQALDLRGCADAVQKMRRAGFEPDDITRGMLLEASVGLKGSGAEFYALLEIAAPRQEQGKNGHHAKQAAQIKYLARSECYAKAMEVYTALLSREGYRPDLPTYAALLRGCAEARQLRTAQMVLQDMAHDGLYPDDSLLIHLLDGCRHSLDLGRGRWFLSHTAKAGVKLSEFSLIAMLKLAGRCGAHKESYGIIAGWEATHGLKPTVAHYTCLMSGCARSRNYTGAWSSYELMHERGVAPDATCIATILPGTVADKHWERCVLVLRHAASATPPIVLAPAMLNSVSTQMLAGGAVPQLFTELQAWPCCDWQPVPLSLPFVSCTELMKELEQPVACSRRGAFTSQRF